MEDTKRGSEKESVASKLQCVREALEVLQGRTEQATGYFDRAEYELLCLKAQDAVAGAARLAVLARDLATSVEERKSKIVTPPKRKRNKRTKERT